MLRQRHDVFDLVGCSRQPAHQVGRARPLGHYLIRARPEAVGKRPGMIERSNAYVLPLRSEEQRSTRAPLSAVWVISRTTIRYPSFFQRMSSISVGCAVTVDPRGGAMAFGPLPTSLARPKLIGAHDSMAHNKKPRIRSSAGILPFCFITARRAMGSRKASCTRLDVTTNLRARGVPGPSPKATQTTRPAHNDDERHQYRVILSCVFVCRIREGVL